MSVSRTTEVERKYSVDDGRVLPDLSSLTGVVSADVQPTAGLDATYVDTADRTLLAARIAVRRRTGGHDAGWHVKLPAPLGRVELQAPIDEEDPEAFPARFELALRSRVRLRPLQPIARIRTERRAVVVRDAVGGAVEVVDDLVVATDIAAGVVRSWREWEAEQVGEPAASAALLEQVHAALLAAGATESDSPAKLAQALGLVGRVAVASSATAGAVLATAVARHTEQLHRGIQALTLDGDPDGEVVHELRKTLRRIRSLLALSPVAGQAGGRLKDLLGPVGTALGEARDPLVQAQVADGLLAALQEDHPDLPGLAAARRVLVDELRSRLPALTAAAAGALGSADSLSAIAALEGFAADGPKAAAGSKALVRAAERTVRRAKARGERAVHHGPEAAHSARKAAKRARYVVEELLDLGLVPARSSLARDARRATRLQDALGEQRDLALVQARLPEVSDQLTREGANAFAVGWLAKSIRGDGWVLLSRAAHRTRRFLRR